MGIQASTLLGGVSLPYRSERLAWFPGDMTAAFLGLSVLAGFVAVLRGGLTRAHVPGLQALWAGAVLALWIAAGQLWSPSRIYAQEKVTLFAAVNLWCLAATAVIISGSRARVWRFLGLLLVLGGAVALDHILAFATVPEGARIEHYLVLAPSLCVTVTQGIVDELRADSLP